jgi:glucokinase
MMGHDAYLAIDAGGTYIKSAVLDSAGSILEGSAFMAKSCSEGSKAEILQAFRGTISQGLRFIGNAEMKLEGIGVAFPGPFNFNKGIPLMKHKFINIYGVDLRKSFFEIGGISTHTPIQFIQDANAVLRGEMWKGNAQGFANAAVITLGTGLGFTFSVDNLIQCNKLGSPAVELYKLPYRDGILEDFTAQRGILRIYREKTRGSDSKDIQVSDIGKGADEGNVDCIHTFCEVGRNLSENIEKILQEKNIQCLLLGGQISNSFHHMEDAIKQGLKDVKSLMKISKVKNISDAALFGAFRAIGSQAPC